jgi:hypothetical protein
MATGSPTSTASPLERHVSPVAGAGRGKGRTALILGIVAVIGALIPILGLILGIIAVVLGASVRSACSRRDRDVPWQATAGLALGIVGILCSVGIFALALSNAG